MGIEIMRVGLRDEKGMPQCSVEYCIRRGAEVRFVRMGDEGVGGGAIERARVWGRKVKMAIVRRATVRRDMVWVISER